MQIRYISATRIEIICADASIVADFAKTKNAKVLQISSTTFILKV